MQRVLHLIWRIDGGGIEQFCINLMKNVDFEKYQFDFCVCGEETHAENDEIFSESMIYHMPLIKGKTGKKEYLSELKKILSETHYDIVHSHLAFMNISTLRIAKRCGVSVRISHTHVAGIGRSNSLKNIIKRKLMTHYATFCFACSHDTAAFYYGLKSANVSVLYSGIDINKFHNETPKNKNKFIVVARVCPEKNPDFCLMIAENLIEKNPNFEFHWYGGGDDLNWLSERAASIKNPFVFHGGVTDVENYIKDAAYMLMPSVKEGFGMASVEAQLSGTFVFASDHVPKDTNLGMIMYYPLDSPQNWAERIMGVIESGVIQNKSIITEKIKDYDMRYTADVITKKYEGSN